MPSTIALAAFIEPSDIDAVVFYDNPLLKYFTASLDRPDLAVAEPLQLTSTALSDSVILIAGSWKLDRALDGKTTVGSPLRVTVVLQKAK